MHIYAQQFFHEHPSASTSCIRSPPQQVIRARTRHILHALHFLQFRLFVSDMRCALQQPKRARTPVPLRAQSEMPVYTSVKVCRKSSSASSVCSICYCPPPPAALCLTCTRLSTFDHFGPTCNRSVHFISLLPDMQFICALHFAFALLSDMRSVCTHRTVRHA